MQLDLTIQRPTTKAYELNIQTGSFMVLKPLLQRGHGALTTILKENGSEATKKTATMNNQTTAMTGLVGVGQRQPLGPLTVIMPVMQVNLSGQVPIISVSQHHGTTKMTHL